MCVDAYLFNDRQIEVHSYARNRSEQLHASSARTVPKWLGPSMSKSSSQNPIPRNLDSVSQLPDYVMRASCLLQ